MGCYAVLLGTAVLRSTAWHCGVTQYCLAIRCYAVLSRCGVTQYYLALRCQAVLLGDAVLRSTAWHCGVTQYCLALQCYAVLSRVVDSDAAVHWWHTACHCSTIVQ